MTQNNDKITQNDETIIEDETCIIFENETIRKDEKSSEITTYSYIPKALLYTLQPTSFPEAKLRKTDNIPSEPF